MRAAIVALVAFALVSPSAARAADAGLLPGSAPAPVVVDAMERIAFPRRQPKVRRHVKRKSAKSVATAKRSKTARAAPATPTPQPPRPGSQASQAPAQPSCKSTPGMDNGRRCLRLADPGPLPMPALPHRPSVSAYIPEAPFAIPSRSWLGAFSKCIVTQVLEVAEMLLVDRPDWRAAMAEEIQWQLEQVRSKVQLVRVKEQDKAKERIEQAPAKEAPPAAPSRRGKGART